jgi:signal peptidase II
LGGSIGNLIDRILFGHVVDFVSVGNFAVFNVADSSITIGVAIMILAMLYQEFKSKCKTKSEGEGQKESS